MAEVAQGEVRLEQKAPDTSSGPNQNHSTVKMAQHTVTNGPSIEEELHKTEFNNQSLPPAKVSSDAAPLHTSPQPSSGQPPVRPQVVFRTDSRQNFQYRPPFPPTNVPSGPQSILTTQSPQPLNPSGPQSLGSGQRSPQSPQVRSSQQPFVPRGPPLGPGGTPLPPRSPGSAPGFPQQQRPIFRPQSPFPRAPLLAQRPHIFQQSSVPAFNRPRPTLEENLTSAQTLDSAELESAKYVAENRRPSTDQRPPSAASLGRSFSTGSPNISFERKMSQESVNISRQSSVESVHRKEDGVSSRPDTRHDFKPESRSAVGESRSESRPPSTGSPNEARPDFKPESRSAVGESRSESRPPSAGSPNEARPHFKPESRSAVGESRSESRPSSTGSPNETRPHFKPESRSAVGESRSESRTPSAGSPNEARPHFKPESRSAVGESRSESRPSSTGSPNETRPHFKPESRSAVGESRSESRPESRSESRLESRMGRIMESEEKTPNIKTENQGQIANGDVTPVTKSPLPPQTQTTHNEIHLSPSETKKKDLGLNLSQSKKGDNDSGVDESTQGNEQSCNGDGRSPRKTDKSSRASSTTPTKGRSLSRGSKTPNSIQSPDSAATTPGSAEKKKIPMNKVQVGTAPSPNIKVVKSKIGSLENASYRPGGGRVKIENKKLDFKNAGPRIEAKNDRYVPKGGEKKGVQSARSARSVTSPTKDGFSVRTASSSSTPRKILSQKLEWNAKSKIGSLENANHKPKGGDKKIETVKLNFKEKAAPKVGSKDNIKHQPGGGDVKIENKKLDIQASSKVGSLDNVKHRPAGGDKKIFDDKDYLKQHNLSSGKSSIGHSLSGSQHSINSQDPKAPVADENLNREH